MSVNDCTPFALILEVLMCINYMYSIMSLYILLSFPISSSSDDLNPESYLDHKLRGQNLDNEGEIQWIILDNACKLHIITVR